jgi:hypothetical protein
VSRKSLRILDVVGQVSIGGVNMQKEGAVVLADPLSHLGDACGE